LTHHPRSSDSSTSTSPPSISPPSYTTLFRSPRRPGKRSSSFPYFSAHSDHRSGSPPDRGRPLAGRPLPIRPRPGGTGPDCRGSRSEEHTSELQSRENLVCRLLLAKKKKMIRQ